MALFDHEEIGSRTKQGAGSMLLYHVLQKIGSSATLQGAAFFDYKMSVEELCQDAMLLSVDVAHGIHPNYAGKMDLTNQPVLGKGFCIKEACSQSYATDSFAIGKHTGIDCIKFPSGSDSGYWCSAAFHAFCTGTDGACRYGSFVGMHLCFLSSIMTLEMKIKKNRAN